MSEIFIIKNTGKGVINSLAPENVVPIKSAGSEQNNIPNIITISLEDIGMTSSNTELEIQQALSAYVEGHNIQDTELYQIKLIGFPDSSGGGIFNGIITEDSDTVAFTGNGTTVEPLTANVTTIGSKLDKPTTDGTFSVKKVGAAVTFEPVSSVIDGFENTSTTNPGSVKNDKILHDSIKKIVFGPGSTVETTVPHGTAFNIGTFIAFTDNGTDVLFNGNTSAVHYGKLFNFSEDKFIITNLVGAEWISFGQKLNGENIAIYVKNDAYKGSIGKIPSNGNANLTGIVATLNFNPDITKSFTFKYLPTTIEIYNNDVLWTTLNKTTVSFFKKVFGVTQADTKTVSYSYAVRSGGTIPTESVSLQVAQNGFPVVFSESNIKYLIPFLGKKVTLYGDSITVAYDSANYASQILAKLGCDTVTRSGESGQSFAGNLQNTTNVNALVATTPALVVIHSVNDHRVNATIGTMADTAGTASTIGGLKTICNALINANKNVQIILCTPMTYGAVAGGYPASNEPNASGKYMFEYAQAIMNFARSYGIAIADFSSLCGFRPQVESTSNRVFTSDGVHPNAGGYEKMTTLIADVVNKQL